MWLLHAVARAAPEMIPAEAMDEVGHVASDFTVPLREGGEFKLSEHRGKPVVLSFWASWCGPCRKELPALSKLAEARPDLTILAINVDRDRSKADAFLAGLDVSLPIAYDSDSVTLGSFSVTSMPTMFVIDRKGGVAFKKTGYSEEHGFTEILGALKEQK